MALRILADTNVILDYILKRQPWDRYAKQIVLACKNKVLTGCIAAHSVPNLFYILRKAYTIQERRDILQDLCKLFAVEGIDKEILIRALDNADFKDFEDCLQMECARLFRADYIVSRNTEDFKNSVIPCVTSMEMCDILRGI